jgi:hypothetical protein
MWLSPTPGVPTGVKMMQTPALNLGYISISSNEDPSHWLGSVSPSPGEETEIQENVGERESTDRENQGTEEKKTKRKNRKTRAQRKPKRKNRKTRAQRKPTRKNRNLT